MASLPRRSLATVRRTLPLRRILVAIVAYYAFVTYQFTRVQPLLDEFPSGLATVMGIDPAASPLGKYLDYLVGATVGDWGISVLYQRPVTAMLAHALPWLALVVAIAVVATVAGVALRERFGPVRVPHWVVGYVVFSLAFLATVALLIRFIENPVAYFLFDALWNQDFPLYFGAKRLLALGYIVGALVASVGVVDRVGTSAAGTPADEGSAKSDATPE